MDTSKKYSVVEFSNDEGVTVVATTWIFDVNETTHCYWPPFKSGGMCNRAVEKCQTADPSWKSYQCRVMYKTDDYAKARSKLHDAELTSSLESEREATDTQNRKRKRGLCQMYVESSESGSDAEQPSKKRHGIPQKTITPKLTVPTPPLPPPPTQPISKLPLSDTENTPRGVGTGRNSAFERHVLTLLQELKDSVVEMKKDIGILMATQQAQMKTRSEISVPEEMPEDINFPLDSADEVAALEAKLHDVNLKQLIIRNVSSIGGASVSDSTRRLLRHLFTNRCARHLNWKGRGGKMALSETSLSSVIIRAVRMNPLSSNASHAEVESHIKDWLKFARERDEGRKLRAEKQRQPRSEPNNSDI